MIEPDGKKEHAGDKVGHRLGILLEGHQLAVYSFREGDGLRSQGHCHHCALNALRERRIREAIKEGREGKAKHISGTRIRKKSTLLQSGIAMAAKNIPSPKVSH